MKDLNEVLDALRQERQRQLDLEHGGDTDAFDQLNTKNDWVAYITAYAGRAADKCARNEREGQAFHDNILKAAALCVAALQTVE